MATSTLVKHSNGKVTASKAQTQDETSAAPVRAIFSFARSLGGAHRKALQDSEELHKSYVKASDAEKRATRTEFMIGYMSGALNQLRETVETIINGRVRFGAQPTLNKPARTREQQQAYDAARKMFSYHIARDDSRTQSANAQQQKRRLSSEFKDAAAEFIGTFYQEVNAAAVTEVIKLLLEYKKRLSKVEQPTAAE